MTLPQVWFVPAVTSSHSTTSRTTTGDRRVESVPSPNSPLALPPQQYARAALTAQLCTPPAASNTKGCGAATRRGLGPPLRGELSPTGPAPWAPQQEVTLSVPSPQLCRSPATGARNAWPPVRALGPGLAGGPPLEPSWLAAL